MWVGNSDAWCDWGRQMATASIYSNLTNEQPAFHLCGAWLLSCSHLHACLKLPFLPFRSEEHLDPPSKDLHLTDNCNSLHSRLCLLTSHKSSFALCIVGDLHPLYFRVLRNAELQCHVFLYTKLDVFVQEAVRVCHRQVECLSQRINLPSMCVYVLNSFSRLVCSQGGAREKLMWVYKMETVHPLGSINM